MARPKSTLTVEQKRERAAAYQRKRRADERAAKKSGDAAPDSSRDPLAAELRRTQARIAVRGQALLQKALEGMAEGKSVTDVMSSFTDSAGHDPETEALVTLLASLQRAVAVRDAVASGNFTSSIVVGEPKPETASGPKRKAAGKKRRRRA